MRSFIAGCVAAIVIAALGAVVLNQMQQSVSVAYNTTGAKL